MKMGNEISTPSVRCQYRYLDWLELIANISQLSREQHLTYMYRLFEEKERIEAKDIDYRTESEVDFLRALKESGYE